MKNGMAVPEDVGHTINALVNRAIVD